MDYLKVRFDRENVWLEGRALRDTDCETVYALKSMAGNIKEIHIDIEYMNCCFSRALYAFLSRMDNAEIYWHIKDPFYVHADLPELYSEVSGRPIKLIDETTFAVA
ncbi:MAG: hypothetical protein GX419_10445 [Bacteroidales bacterium]|jgi:hypothetical protein|nr:hypothetical protein [Bacteroidales bacterium]